MEPNRHEAEERYYHALDLLAEGQPASAATGFRAALAADPSFLDAQHGLIRALQDCGAYDEGIAAAQALAAAAPDDVLAYTALSILYQHKGLIPEAEAAATRAKLLGWKQHLRASAQAAQLAGAETTGEAGTAQVWSGNGLAPAGEHPSAGRAQTEGAANADAAGSLTPGSGTE